MLDSKANFLIVSRSQYFTFASTNILIYCKIRLTFETTKSIDFESKQDCHIIF